MGEPLTLQEGGEVFVQVLVGQEQQQRHNRQSYVRTDNLQTEIRTKS